MIVILSKGFVQGSHVNYQVKGGSFYLEQRTRLDPDQKMLVVQSWQHCKKKNSSLKGQKMLVVQSWQQWRSIKMLVHTYSTY